MTQTTQTPAPQRWILSPTLDGLFVLAAPVLAVAAAILAMSMFGARAIPAILVFHVVATVAHHLPTFLRIYGDVELFKRFKWTFLLGPLLPFGIAMGALTYINLKGYPLETFFYLMIVLTLWDPWHFFMQHYGFMRIYDRGQPQVSRWSGRFDFWLCAVWFGAMLLLSTDWVVQLVVGLYEHSRLPVLLIVSMQSLHFLQTLAGIATVAISLAYLGYQVSCWRRGQRPNAPKLLLCVVTFGVMYLAYTPNALMAKLAPGWTFQVGFAVIGIVHVSQYLAIVWRYNRALANRPGRFRQGWLQRWQARAGGWVALAYVLLCLGYGLTLTTVHENRWLMSVMLAAGFTSTLMHYYFDGFIWKVRHVQNQEVFSEKPAAGAPVVSWWTNGGTRTAGATLLRQAGYFGIPMGLLSLAAWWVWSPPPLSHLDHMQRAQACNLAGDEAGTRAEIRAAMQAMNDELPIARRLVELKSTPARESALGFLLYWKTHYEEVVWPELNHLPVEPQAKEQWRAGLAEAVKHLDKALALDGPVNYPGREGLTREDLQAARHSWLAQAGFDLVAPGSDQALAQRSHPVTTATQSSQ